MEDKKIIVNLGCGKKMGHPEEDEVIYGVDIRKFDGVDFVCDVRKDKLPFEDNSVDKITSDHLFEHLGEVVVTEKNDKGYVTDAYIQDGFLHCIQECWRILKPTGELDFNVPRFPHDAAIIHPDHKRWFVPNSFSFFNVPADGIDRHGYLDGKFWYVGVDKDKQNTSEDNIHVIMYPNKPGIDKIGYKKVRKL